MKYKTILVCFFSLIMIGSVFCNATTVNLSNNYQPLGTKESGYFWMDFNSSSDPHSVDGGRFESESWTCGSVVTHDDFDDTPEMSWANQIGIYSAVRDDEDLNDGTTTEGSYCSCAKETGGPVWNEDSRGYATVQKSFDLSDYVDTSLPNFAFTEVIFYCDYKIHAADFDCDDSYVYLLIYLNDGNTEWPIKYEEFSNADDAPSGTNGGYCIDFWDPQYTGSNPNFFKDNYENDEYTISTDGQGGQTDGYLKDLFNSNGDTYTLKFKLYARLFGGWAGQSERYKFWIDHARIKCNYEYAYPDLTVTDIWTDPSTFYHGDTVNLKAEIKNIGDGSVTESFYVNMYFDDSYIGYAQVPAGMPSGGTETVTYLNFEWPDDIDLHTIKVIADNDNDVDESDENNNDLEEDFQALNHAPNTPTLTGETSGWHGVQYSYTVSATDDDGDDVKYYIDWGDGTNTGWFGWYNSGQSATKTHTWSEPGDYDSKAKAKDEFDDESNWYTLSVNMGNRAPNPPNTPSGETNGYHGTEYSYITSATDPDGDDVCYWFDWGDGTSSGWTDLYDSGQSVSESHTWEEKGNFQVKVKAKDEYESESGWSPILYVTMGNRAPNSPYNPDPEDNEDLVDINANLSWDCDDPDGDDLVYDIYLDIVNPPLELVKQNHQSKTYNPDQMEPETTYYWQIIAKDDWDATSGPIWQFTTREYNSPELSNYDSWPEGVDKEWGANSDTFTFKVHYFDPDGDPPQIQNLYVKIDGGSISEYEMECEGSDPADADYSITLQGNEFGGGIHSYYFEYTDVTGDSDRLPDSGFWYFTVNHQPNTPTVVGDGKVKKGEEYTCKATATDNDGDQIQYYFEWGDGGNTGWVPSVPVNSGTTETRTHTYDEYETVTIQVKARDVHGDESDWGTLTIEVSKNRQSINSIILQILERLMNRFPLLTQILLSRPIFNR